MATQNSTPLANLTDEQFGELARSILVRELGPEGLIRFQNLGANGSDYTRDRHHWQDNITLEEIVEQIRKQRS
jgi:hypothetical protein